MIIGLALGIAIGFITEYYTSESKKPAQAIAAASQTGAATNIIAGLALGMRSTGWPLFLLPALGTGAYPALCIGSPLVHSQAEKKKVPPQAKVPFLSRT
jgi:hypothetical protein